jgi:hypothetical protein
LDAYIAAALLAGGIRLQEATGTGKRRNGAVRDLGTANGDGGDGRRRSGRARTSGGVTENFQISL